MRFLYLLGLFVLSGCFLEQKAPHNGEPNPTQANTSGVVRLEDLSGLDLDAVSIRGSFQDTVASQALAMRLDSRANPCRVQKSGGRAATRGLKSVGELYFGPVMQSTLTKIPRKEDNAYFLALTPDFPSNVYYVTSRQENGPNFEGYLSLPESLGGVTANGSDFDTEGVLYKRSEKLTVQWNAPSVAVDNSLIMVELVAEGETEGVGIRCMGAEPTDGGGVYEWTLPAESVTQLPDSDRGLIYVSRVHIGGVEKDGWDVQLQGLRTRVTVMRVEP